MIIKINPRTHKKLMHARDWYFSKHPEDKGFVDYPMFIYILAEKYIMDCVLGKDENE